MSNTARVSILLTAKDATAAAFNSVRGRLKTLGASTLAAATGIQGAIAGMVGGMAAAGVSKFVLDTTREFERLRAQLKTWTGSADRANAKFADMQKLARTLPEELTGVTQAWINMRRAGLDPTNEQLTGLADLAASASSDLASLTHGITRASMGEFDPLETASNVRLMVKDANTLSATFKGVTTDVERSAAGIRDYLLQISQDNFAGAAAERMETLDGKISNLQDNFAAVAELISEGGVRDAFGGVITDTVELTDAIIENGQQVKAWTRLIVAVLAAVARTVVAPVQMVWNAIESVLDVAGLAFISFRWGLSETMAFILRTAADLAKGLGADGLGGTLEGMAERNADWARHSAARFGEWVEKLKEDTRDGGDAAAKLGLSYKELYDSIAEFNKVPPPRAVDPYKADEDPKNPTDPAKAAEAARKAQEERIRALVELAGYEETRRDALVALVREEEALRKALQATNLAVEERARLMGLRASVNEAISGRAVAGMHLDKVDPLAPVHSLARTALAGGPALPGQEDKRLQQLRSLEILLQAALRNPATPANELVGLFEQLEEVQVRLGRFNWAERLGRSLAQGRTRAEQLRDTIDGIASNSLSAFSEAVGSAMAGMVDGSISAGAAFASSMVGAVAQAAKAMGDYFMGLAIGAVGKAIAGGPMAAGQVAAAAQFGAAATALYAVGGAVQGSANRIASAGSRGGGSDRAGEDLPERGGHTLVVEGGLLDLSDPRQEDAFRQALETMSGRRVVVRKG